VASDCLINDSVQTDVYDELVHEENGSQCPHPPLTCNVLLPESAFLPNSAVPSHNVSALRFKGCSSGEELIPSRWGAGDACPTPGAEGRVRSPGQPTSQCHAAKSAGDKMRPVSSSAGVQRCQDCAQRGACTGAVAASADHQRRGHAP